VLNTLPFSIEIIQFVANHLQQIEPLFKKSSEEFDQLKTFIKNDVSFKNNEAFKSTPILVTYVQLLFLLGISMHEGMETPKIKQVKIKDDTISITWDSTINISCTLGTFDKKGRDFLDYAATKLFAKKPSSKSLSFKILDNLFHLLSVYVRDLNQSQTRINTLLSNQSNIVNFITEESHQDLFFIVLTSLPSDKLNMLYLYIQQFIPEELELNTARGNKVLVKSFFELSTQDINLLIEKIKLHFNLFFFYDSPEIKEITQSKTKEFLNQLLDDKSTLDETIENIIQSRDQQIGTRKGLYEAFIKTHPSLK